MSHALLRLHATLTQTELWSAARVLCDSAIRGTAQSLVFGGGEGLPERVYRHRLPAPRRKDSELAHPETSWLLDRPGAAVYRLSDLVSLRELRSTPYYSRVMRPGNWDKRLSLVAWNGRVVKAQLHWHRSSEEPDFSPRDVRTAEALQPHFQTAVTRVLTHEAAVFRGEHVTMLTDEAPAGLLLLDWDLRPLWYNREGANVCAVWNHGERGAQALRAKRAFRVPAPIATACSELKHEWMQAWTRRSEGMLALRPIHDEALGVHAEIKLRTPDQSSIPHPAFHIRLDYRRPRADRNRALSPSAVALLGRLTAREREVAMRLREGLSTREIAAELRRSPLTIKTQVRDIFTKVEVNNRARLAALLNR